VTRIQNVSVGGERGLLVEAAQFVLVNVLLDRANAEGVTLRGAVQGVTVNNHSKISTGISPTAVYFDAGSSTSLARFNAGNYLLGVGAVGIRKNLTATLALVGFFSNSFNNLGGVALDNVSADGQTDVLFLGNFGTANSKTGGNIGISANAGNIATIILAANVWEPIGSGNAVDHPPYTLDPASARAVLVQPAGAPSGVIALAASETVNVTVFATVSARSVTGTQKEFAGRVVKNPFGVPVVLSPTFGAVTGSAAASSTGTVAFQVSTMMDPGDVLQLQITNRTDGTDLVVDSANLGFVVATT
jgi:hypothetical protein